MARRWFTSALCALALLAPASLGAASAAEGGQTSVRVLTRNLYLGADLAPVLAATSPQGLVAAVTAVYANVQATNFPERAEALADEIADSDPHLVGLQEAVLWRSQTPAGQGSATHVEYDFLQILLDELSARGKHYAAVATVTVGTDFEAPRSTPAGLQDIRLTDRDVLLARTDLPARKFSVANARAAQFRSFVPLCRPVLGCPPSPPLQIRRGWVAADATVHGRTTRVVTTHLEPAVASVQEAQADELLAGPLKTKLPTVLLGDLNSAAGGVGATPESNTTSYDDILAAGFSDAWTATHRRDPGFTCCQAANLLNPTSSLAQRIDYVLYRGRITALSSDRVGDEQADRTPSGLWPSDHAGVTGELRLR
ncbi:endonuclease/exonuclease/phosphatase family protein [Streptomyces sp. NBC_00249]|uniref:endonuclease/exonuclease/phosphatase family protein n=1 Tax=Streptomyces sp. NBC_00249 TaxID=2975690 RepID=UPI00224EF4DB|nr:endonuclease/exonuclease/phosphatase family protein [Streptomyces sp. NBC_00249]MCX5195612.1 endonuclease/exonuclease/phosphatase family protein [Streptomyces sp. NBC_00249]